MCHASAPSTIRTTRRITYPPGRSRLASLPVRKDLLTAQQTASVLHFVLRGKRIGICLSRLPKFGEASSRMHKQRSTTPQTHVRNLRHQECSRHRRDAIGRRDHCGNSGQDPERGPQLSVGSDANRRRRKLFSVLEGGLKAWREQGLPVSRSLEDPKVIAARLGVKLPNS